MFDIKYAISDDIDELVNFSSEEFDLNGDVEGYIELTFCSMKYGYCNKALIDNGILGNELIGSWFERLLSSCAKLFDNQVVYLNDIESPDHWIRFEKVSNINNINVTVVKNHKMNGSKYVEIVLDSFEKVDIYPVAQVSLNNMIRITVDKTQHFLDSLITINSKLEQSQRVRRLEDLINNVQKNSNG